METKEVRSAITKRTMAAALKDLMEIKPLQDITVLEITESCRYHRQTFYYHFTDIKDLLRWTFEEEAEAFISEHPLSEDLEDIFRTIFLFLSKNQKFCSAAYQTLGRDALIDYFTEDTHKIIYSAVTSQAGDAAITGDDAEFITAVLSSVLLTHAENWVCRKSIWSLDEIIRQIHYLTEDLIAGAKRRRAGNEMKKSASGEANTTREK